MNLGGNDIILLIQSNKKRKLQEIIILSEVVAYASKAKFRICLGRPSPQYPISTLCSVSFLQLFDESHPLNRYEEDYIFTTQAHILPLSRLRRLADTLPNSPFRHPNANNTFARQSSKVRLSFSYVVVSGLSRRCLG